MKDRLKNLLIALDQFLWVALTFGAGKPDETISAAAFRMEMQEKLSGLILRPAIDWIASPWQADHCHNSYVAERLRKQLPEVYLEEIRAVGR